MIAMRKSTFCNLHKTHRSFISLILYVTSTLVSSERADRKEVYCSQSPIYFPWDRRDITGGHLGFSPPCRLLLRLLSRFDTHPQAKLGKFESKMAALTESAIFDEALTNLVKFCLNFETFRNQKTVAAPPTSKRPATKGINGQWWRLQNHKGQPAPRLVW